MSRGVFRVRHRPPSGRVLTYSSVGSETRRQTVTSTFAVPPPSRGTLTRTALLWSKFPESLRIDMSRGVFRVRHRPPSGRVLTYSSDGSETRRQTVTSTLTVSGSAGSSWAPTPAMAESVSTAARNPTIHLLTLSLTSRATCPDRPSPSRRETSTKRPERRGYLPCARKSQVLATWALLGSPTPSTCASSEERGTLEPGRWDRRQAFLRMARSAACPAAPARSTVYLAGSS